MKNFLSSAIFLLIGIALISSCTKEDAVIKPADDKDQSVKQTTEITLEEARADLESLLADIDNPLSRAGGNYRRIKNSYSLPVNGAETRSGDSTSQLVHIFNFENNQGYAIMSGDKRIPSLLALTEKGSITQDESINIPGVALFLEGVEEMYSNLLGGPGNWEPLDSTRLGGGGYTELGNSEHIVYPQGGLCSVKWGQREPYNMYCPIKNDTITKTGCAATAIAQLMSIHKYPESYDGYIFPWDRMNAYIGGIDYVSYNPVGIDGIARLMQQLGLKKNLDVTYGTQSGADVKNTLRTLKNFGYSQWGTHQDYDISAIVSDIKTGYPVLLSGYSEKKKKIVLGIHVGYEYDGGHEWLVHGLLEGIVTAKTYNSEGVLVNTYKMKTNYFLCNWGWSGLHDGYYWSGAFNTNTDGDFPVDEPSTRSDMPGYYQHKLTIITGIRP